MKLINGQIRLIEKFDTENRDRAYVCEQLQNPGLECFVKILDRNIHNALIQDYIENIEFYKSINHKGILSTIDFGAVRTIDLKESSDGLYYILSEYTPWETLEALMDKLSTHSRTAILLKLIEALDYLHFRGISYDVLSPEKIFVTPEGNLKLLNVTSIVHSRLQMDNLKRRSEYITPEFKGKNNGNHAQTDCWSLGVIMGKLFSGIMPELHEKKQDIINDMIEDLMTRSSTTNRKSLASHFKTIRSEFEIDYARDLKKEREALQLDVFPRRTEKKHLSYLRKESFEELYGKGYSGLMVDGNGGIGKKRYIREILRRRRLEGGITYMIEAGEGDYSSIDHFKVFLVQLCEVLGIDYSIDSDSNDISIWLRDSFEVFRLDQLDSKLKLFNSITEELIRLSKREAVFLGVMNLQDADVEIFNLIDFIVTKSRGKRVYFVVSVQKSKLRDSRKIMIMNQWHRNNVFEEIHLENLSSLEAREYICSILGNMNVPEELFDALYNETLGNPRYIRVLIKNFTDNGIIGIDDNGFWATTTDDYFSFYDSSTLKKTIVRQIRSMNTWELKALKLLSCFSHQVDMAIFIEILGMDGSEFREMVMDLANRGITRLDIHTERLISFTEGDFKRQIYSELPEEERVELHGSIVDVLLSKRDDNHVINFDSLIYHLSESRQLDRMLEIVLQRLEKEKNRYNDKSVNILKVCYKNLKDKDHPSILMVLKYLTEALLAQRRYSEGMESAETYLNEARRINHTEESMDAELIMLEFIIRAGDYREALEKITEYETIVLQSGGRENRINFYKLKSILCQVLDRVDESHAAIAKALQLSQEYGVHEHDGDLYNLQGIGYYLVGNHEEALKSYHRSIETYVLSERDFDRIKPLNNIGNLYNERIGDPLKALDYYFQCLKVSDENGLSSFQTITLTNICDVYLTLGAYDDARSYINKTIELSHINGDRINEFHGNVYMGILELSLQNMEEATEIFLRVREFNKEEPIVEKEVIVHYLDFLGRFYMELGDYELGKMFSRNSMDKARDFNPKLYFRSKTRILTIDSILNGKIDRKQVEALFNEVGVSTNDYEKAAFLIEMMHISLHMPDIKGYDYFRSLFVAMDSKEARCLYENDFEIMNTLQARESQFIEDSIELLENGNRKFSQSMCRYYSYVGEMLYGDGDYIRAARYLIRAMDLVQTKINQIGIDGYKDKILINYNIPRVKQILDEILIREFNIPADKLESGTMQSGLVGRYISMLDHDQYNRLFLEDGTRVFPATVEGLLSSMTHDYRLNLERILTYLHHQTGANDSLINIFKHEEVENDSSLIRFGKGELEMNQFVDSTLRSGGTVIFNRDMNILSMDINKEYFDKKLSGFIGVPIVEPSGEDLETERRTSSRKSRILGYVYLQTDSAINRFDQERIQLSMSMAKLMYLNLENRKLHRRANYDKLTNVLSRESIESELDEVIEMFSGTDNEFSLLMMDIDRFKDLNDSYGHQKGDQILKIIGEVLNDSTRASDHVGRYGGEEFLVLLENISVEDTKSVAEAIRYAIQVERRFSVDRKVTISIGISHYPDHGTSKDELVYKADQALYFAKEILGRNSVALWDDDMEEIESISSKGHKVALEVFGKSHNGMVALMDIAVLSRSQETIGKKLFRFLGALNESVDAELASLLIIENGEVTDQFTREAVGSSWTDNKAIDEDMIHKTLETKESSLTVNWAGASYNMGTVDISSLKSIIMTPVMIGESIKAIVYCESSLRRKDFTPADVMAVEVLSGVFSVNLV